MVAKAFRRRMTLSFLLSVFLFTGAALYVVIGYREMPPHVGDADPVTIYQVGWPVVFYVWYTPTGYERITDFSFLALVSDLMILTGAVYAYGWVLNRVFPSSVAEDQPDDLSSANPPPSASEEGG